MFDMGPRTGKLKRNGITLQKPTLAHAAGVHALVRECAPLDENSLYFYLIQCDQFRDTCVLAEREGEVQGWLSAHLPPAEPESVFVWQVAVGEAARGAGLGSAMLEELVRRPECNGVRHLRTTITPDNDASWALFRRFADSCGAEIADEPHYLEEPHFDGLHDTEHMVTLTFPEPVRLAA